MGDHEVLGTPIRGPFPERMEHIVVAMGCFWGPERLFWQLDGVHTTAVGYAGGTRQHPSYEQVCSGETGHAEVVLIVFDPERIELETLLAKFWEYHDPTTPHRGAFGSQYRSAIFANGVSQLETALLSRNHYQSDSPIAAIAKSRPRSR